MPPSHPDRPPPTLALGDHLIRVVKLLHAIRQHAPRQHAQVDPMAYPLLFNLRTAPMRVSALADAVHSDVSTVSRQVTALVDLGFVRRGPDPDDRRAQALSLTDTGEALLVAIREDRDRWLRGLLADWPPEDVDAFATHLQHFASDLEASLHSLSRRTDR